MAKKPKIQKVEKSAPKILSENNNNRKYLTKVLNF